MHDTMKELLPDAMFIGFTGTPLLKADKYTSFERFGSFIHTYKFDEAVQDGVVLDLRYEARDIDQHLDLARQGRQVVRREDQGHDRPVPRRAEEALGHDAEGRQLRAAGRADRRRHPAGHGDQAAADGRPGQRDARQLQHLSGMHVLRLFCEAGFKGKCAIVTSYGPQPGDISKEDSGQGMTERLRQYEIYRQMLADHFDEPADDAMHKVEQFEQDVKEQFIENPGQMRLLIVVDKLLTGFDAPPATYLYIDKTMRDHGLFQAICRVNRLDGEDKDYGYIVDYRDLFNSLRSAITDYTTGALDGYDKQDIDGLLKDRVDTGARGSRRRPGADPSHLRAGRAAEEHAPVPAVLLRRRAGQRRSAEGQRAEAGRAVQGRRRGHPRVRQPRQRHGRRRLQPTPRLPRSGRRSPTTPASATR